MNTALSPDIFISPSLSLLSVIERPLDTKHMEAVLERAAELKQGPRPYLFQDWLDDQKNLHLDLTHFNEHTAQNFLYRHGADIREQISPHAISVALAIGARWGWNTRFQGSFPDESRNSQTAFKDETFLEWLTVHWDAGSSISDELFWPNTPEEFAAFDAFHKPSRNMEWIMAMTIASGSNPWTMERSQRRELAFHNCIGKYHKIAAQLLTLPGAPTLRELMEKPYFYNDHKSLSEHIFSELGTSVSTKKNPDSTLWNLVMVSPEFRYTLEELSQLPLKLFEQAVRLNRLPDTTAENTIKYLETQTTISRTYGLKGFMQRRELIQPFGGSIEQAQATHVTQSILNGKQWGGILSWRDRLEQQGCGPNWLCQKTRVEGPWAGNWSVFNAHMFQTVCQPNKDMNSYGTNRLPWNIWLFDEIKDVSYRNEEGTIRNSYPELASLLNEDLENGLPVTGLWTLAILGKYFYNSQNTQEHVRFFQTKPTAGETHQPLIRVERLEDEARALNIDNWQWFFEQHREAAVEATEWIVSHAPQPSDARQALRQVWGRCLERFPSWMERHPELMTRAIRSLAPGFQPYWIEVDEWVARKHTWTDVLFLLPDLFRSEFTGNLSQLTPLNLACNLAVHHPTAIEEVIEWLELANSPDPQMVSWIREWLPDHGGMTSKRRQHPKYPLSRELVSRLTAGVLKHQIPGAECVLVRKRL